MAGGGGVGVGTAGLSGSTPDLWRPFPNELGLLLGRAVVGDTNWG